MKIAKRNMFVLAMAFVLLSFVSCSNPSNSAPLSTIDTTLNDNVKSSFTEVQNTELILKKVWGDGYVTFFDLAVRKADGSLFGGDIEEYNGSSLEVIPNNKDYFVGGVSYSISPSNDNKEILIQVTCEAMGESLETQNVNIAIPDITDGNTLISDIGSIEATIPPARGRFSFNVDESSPISELILSDFSVQFKYRGEIFDKKISLVTENGYIEHMGSMMDIPQTDYGVYSEECFVSLLYYDGIPIMDVKGIKIDDVEYPITLAFIIGSDLDLDPVPNSPQVIIDPVDELDSH